MLNRGIKSLTMVAIALFFSLMMSTSPACANIVDATAWNNLGQQFFSQQRYPDALLAYNHALLIEPEYSLVLANRCGVLSQLEEYSQALASCNLALEIDRQWGAQGSALGWDNRGDALFNLERYQEALYSFEQALVHNPSYENAYRNRQIVLSWLEHIDKNS